MMKKIILCLMLAVSFVLASCSGCHTEQPDFNGNGNNDTVTVIESLVVENVISTSREGMFLNYGGDYRWFETCILMKDYMDSETDGSVEAVTSVFQVITEKETGFDTHVVMTVQTLDTNTVEIKHGFWVEDFPLNDEEINLTFEEAFLRANEANYPKPHSKHCVLRREVGPNPANAQYIFGNNKGQIYVDAVTGEVSDKNPVFPELTGPLGEWP